MKAYILLMALSAAALAGTAATAQDGRESFVILESNAPAYPAAMLIDDDAIVRLRARERIAFIGRDGVVREAVGRFDGRLGDAAAITRNREAVRRRLAGRGGGGVDPPAPTGLGTPHGGLAAGSTSGAIDLEGPQGAGGAGDWRPDRGGGAGGGRDQDLGQQRP